MPSFSTRRMVEPGSPAKSAEPNTAESLIKEMHELIDMLSDDMLGKAAYYISRVPDFPEDFDATEIERLELAKHKLRIDKFAQSDDSEAAIGSTSESDMHPHQIRDNLHRLAEHISREILDEAVDVLRSTALLDIPVEPTEEEIRILRETDEEFERGEFFSSTAVHSGWEQSIHKN